MKSEGLIVLAFGIVASIILILAWNKLSIGV
jgi:hypothetical protein